MRLLMAGGLAAAALVGCSGDGQQVEGLEQAREFGRHPLYWVGESFEGLQLRHVSLAPGPSRISAFVYGDCEAEGDQGCPAPLDIQVRPLCVGLAAAARDRDWSRRELRGAPLGTFDGAPVLFTSRVQVKVYARERGQALRALRALRSVNTEPPVVGADDRFPPAPRAVLDGARRCGDST